ncbi:hypothetical protein, partial [Streptomyces bohaiensis]|uniref:hypothetical protein n=1 Tax=Streptomyces bohaiensis TaxID=1431344 RepID=UPI0030C6973B
MPEDVRQRLVERQLALSEKLVDRVTSLMERQLELLAGSPVGGATATAGQAGSPATAPAAVPAALAGPDAGT